MTGIILAGGENKRMGVDKAFLTVAGIPMIEHVLRTLGSVVHQIIIVTNSPERYQAYDARVVTDRLDRRGPLTGIYSGLSSSGVWASRRLPYSSVAMAGTLCGSGVVWAIRKVAPTVKAPMAQQARMMPVTFHFRRSWKRNLGSSRRTRNFGDTSHATTNASASAIATPTTASIALKLAPVIECIDVSPVIRPLAVAVHVQGLAFDAVGVGH